MVQLLRRLAVLLADQQRRWATDNPCKVEDYLAGLPELPGNVDWKLQLAIGEFEARRETDCPLSAQEISSRFPELGDTLRDRIQDVTLGHQSSARQSDKKADDPATLPPVNQIVPTTALLINAGSGLDVTLESDSDGSPLTASSASNARQRVKYFGDYELLGEVARGGMGVVYKARQVKLNRVVALKMILSAEFASKEAIRRFRSEAEAAANLDHPGIVPIFEIGEHDGKHYFSMGFVEGHCLQTKLSKGPIRPQDAAIMCRKIAFAVHYAHARGVIHRDLKPSNILLDHNGEPRITDFGLAKRIQDDCNLTANGQVLGTPSYMPPEQAIGDIASIGPQADVYSLGAILYALLIGLPPFRSSSVSETLRQVVELERVAPRRLNREIPIDLETICLKAIEKAPHRRYESAKLFADELSRFLEGRPIEARPIYPLAKGWRLCARNPITAMLCAALILAMVCGTFLSTYFAIQSRENERNAFAAFDKADAALATAQEQALNATRASSKAESELAKFESAYYAARLAQAQSKIQSGDLAAAQDILRTIGSLDPAKFEHRFLWTCCSNAQSRSRSGKVESADINEASNNKRAIVAPADPLHADLLFVPKTRHLALSHDGMTFVTAGNRGEHKLWSSVSNDVLQTITFAPGYIAGVPYSKDNRLLLVKSGSTATVYEVTTGQPDPEFKSIQFFSIRENDLKFLGRRGERVIGHGVGKTLSDILTGRQAPV